MRVVKQCPELLQCQILIIIAHFFALVVHDAYFELVVNWMPVGIEQAFDQRIDGCERYRGTADSDAVLDGGEPLGEFFNLDIGG